MASSDMLSTNGVREHDAWVLCLFGITLLAHLVILAFTFPGNDNVYYYDDAKIALNLIEGKGYSISYVYRNWLLYEAVLKTAKLQDPVTQGTRTTALKQPVYPLLLAGLFYSFGPKNFLVVFLVHALFASLTVSLLFLSLRKTVPFTALALALGTAFYPPLAVHRVTTPESTTLLVLLISALWLCLVKISNGASQGLWILAGAIGAVAVLTDPVTLPFVGISFCYGVYLDRRSLRKRVTGLCMALGVALLAFSPWLIRNYLVFDRFPVFKSGAAGHIFNWGLHFSGKGAWIPEERMVALEKAGRNLSELEEEEAIQQELLSMLPSHWREYVTYDVPHYFLHFWWDVPRYWDNYSIRYLAGRRIPYLLVLLLALPHLIRTIARLAQQLRSTLKSMVPEVSMLTLIVTYTAIYSLFGPFHSRYRLPVELALLVFASATLRPLVETIWNNLVSLFTPEVLETHSEHVT
jgi:dolichyl-phosphate-mannose-protein mannosyltransferase